jgi:hypothetical protein
MKKLLTLVFAAAFVIAFTAPAYAALTTTGGTITFYGNVRMDTFRVDNSKEFAGGKRAAALNFDDVDTDWRFDQGGNSRFGARFTYGDFRANVELRTSDTGGGIPGAHVRQWWGSWNFGQGEILVGHTWSPLFLACGCGARLGGTATTGYGDMGGSLRQPMIRIRVKSFTIGFLTPNTRDETLHGHAAGTMEQDTTLPKIEATYSFKFQPATITLFFGYNSYEQTFLANNRSYDVNSMIYGVKVSAAIQAFSFNGVLWRGEHPNDYGLIASLAFNPVYTATNNDISDTDSVGWSFSGVYRINDMFSIGAGYHAIKHKRQQQLALEEEDADDAYYVNLPIRVAKYFTVTPEVGKINRKDWQNVGGGRAQEGTSVWWGAYWKIDF